MKKIVLGCLFAISSMIIPLHGLYLHNNTQQKITCVVCIKYIDMGGPIGFAVPTILEPHDSQNISKELQIPDQKPVWIETMTVLIDGKKRKYTQLAKVNDFVFITTEQGVELIAGNPAEVILYEPYK